MGPIWVTVVLLLLIWLAVFALGCGKCGIGKCVDGRCLCPAGFWGSNCQYGRKSLTKSTGVLSDYSDYYIPLTKISWLIESQRKNSSIEFELDSFATECAWDHLYIYDGLSIYDPLIAALSGKLWQPLDSQNKTIKRKILAKSGSAMVYFYSDKSLDDEGFNISYRISNCSNETCSGRGYCNEQNSCECEDEWTGTNCSLRKCCPHEVYNLASMTYNCPKLMFGGKCPSLVSGRASHAAVAQDSTMWVYGGYSFNDKSNDLLSYNLITKAWSVADSSPRPTGRFGHSMVFYDKKLYIYGGIKTGFVITNELWEFNTQTKLWKLVTVKGDTPIAVTGHASVVVLNQMYVIMGYSPERSFCDCIQKLDLGTMEWKLVNAKGALVTGTFGHSATYDRAKDLIFVYGGYTLLVDSTSDRKEVSSMLFSFNPNTKAWKVLPRSNQPRMLHSSVIIGRMLVIYGGSNHHHLKIKDADKKCYSHDALVYNIDCNSWREVSSSRLLNSLGRFGHTAVQYNRTMYIFGGFDGAPRNDIIPITIGNCSGFPTRTQCLNAPFLANCVWNTAHSRCMDAESSISQPKSAIESPHCNETIVECRSFGTCETCLSNRVNCAWCDKSCQDSSCKNAPGVQSVTDSNSCPASLKFTCTARATCYSCELHPNCTWSITNGAGLCRVAGNKGIVNASAKCSSGHASQYLCNHLRNCSQCISASKFGCMWCESQNLCLDTQAYFINFPFGQCLEWINSMTCPETKCSGQNTCQDCFSLPGCGWCANTRSTGIGVCMDGTNRGDLNAVCPAQRWYYTKCPSCQCNGHSLCGNTSLCIKCENNTAGKHCELCKPGYYGEARYNGTCKKCFCNNHGLSCNNLSGKCECDTKGLAGDHCDRCESVNYIGNATNGGHCFYKLRFGFQYTYNRTSKNHNFFAVPEETNGIMKFEITVRHGDRAYMNFSYTLSGVERFVVKRYRLGSYSRSFSAETYKAIANVEPTFKVYIYNISKNCGFQVSFEQNGPPQLSWLQFLIVFLICFCSLLIILIVVWKLKQQYSSFQYNRRRRVELHEMASRPFSAIKLCCDGGLRLRRRVEPSPVGVEPFAHSQLAVASILIELPRSEKGISPKGQSGLCIGSTVIIQKHQNLLTNAQHQLCKFKDRQKRHHHIPVDV